MHTPCYRPQNGERQSIKRTWKGESLSYEIDIYVHIKVIASLPLWNFKSFFKSSFFRIFIFFFINRVFITRLKLPLNILLISSVTFFCLFLEHFFLSFFGVFFYYRGSLDTHVSSCSSEFIKRNLSLTQCTNCKKFDWEQIDWFLVQRQKILFFVGLLSEIL